MTEAAEPWVAVDLAREADFRLGDLLVSPSTSRVHGPAGEQRVEPRVMEVLVVLARSAGRTVTRDQLIESCWGGRIVSDDAVSRAAAQVRALARGTSPPPFVLETVPKVGFRLIPAEARETPAAAPPAAVPAAPPRRASPPPPPRLWARIGLAALVLVALAAAGWAGWSRLGPRQAAFDQNGRIDVMAFQPRGADPETQKLAADISEQMVGVLARAGEQTTSHPIPRDTGSSDSELRIAGTVQRDGGSVLINSQIIDRKSGVVMLASRILRPAAAIRTVAPRAVWVLAGDLHCALEDRKRSREPLSREAFSLYLNACAGVFEEPNAARMLAVTRRLVAVAPKFAGGHAMHGIAAALMADGAATPDAAAALHQESKAAADLALRLDPRTPKAYSALALNEGLFSDGIVQNWLAQETYLKKALALDPDLPPAWSEYATMLRQVGRLKAATDVMAGGNAVDPRAGDDPRLAMLKAAAGDLAGAEAHLRQMEASGHASMDSVRFTIAFWWEAPAAALPKLRAFNDPDRPEARVACREQYLRRLTGAGQKGLPQSCTGLDRNWRIRMLAREGDVDGAFAELHPPIPGGVLLFYYPEMRAFRADPRFWSLARKLGLVDYWTRSGQWPDFCAEPGLGYDCRRMAGAIAAASAPARSAAR